MPTGLPPRQVFYGVTDLGLLRRRLHTLPGALPATTIRRLTPDTQWSAADPCAAPVLRGAEKPATVWFWEGTDDLFLASAGRLLRQFVLPLCRSGEPFRVALPVDQARLAPSRLSLQTVDRLDAEDIGTLLREATRATGADSCATRGRPAGPERPAHLTGLDERQADAATHRHGPARVLAPAGAGKTKTMIAHVADLVASGVRPKQILVLAFNTEAAMQLEERLAGMGIAGTRRIPPLPAAVHGVDRSPRARDGVDGVHCATFNAFGFRYQRDVVGSVPCVSAGGAQRERALRAALAGVCEGRPAVGGGLPGSESRTTHPDPFDAALSDRAWQSGLLLDAARSDLSPVPDDAIAFMTAYDRHQARSGVQAFDDQVYAAVLHLLATPLARVHVQSVYRHVLVDEFQDVNAAQLALLDILSRPRRDLFVVGDDDQLIYGWRHARPESIVEFGEHRPRLASPTTYVLQTNYRGSREVVDHADRLVRNNRIRVVKDVRARADAPQGSCCLCGVRDWPARSRSVAAYLAAERARLGCDWSGLAVLCRYRVQLEAIALRLRELGLPVPRLAPADLFSAPVARGIRERLERLLSQSGLGSSQERALAAWIANERPVAVAALDEAVAVLGLARGPAAEGDAGGAQEVLDAARLLAWDHPDLRSFLEQWSRLDPGRPPTHASCAEAGDAVVLATIHATKGREYESVAIVDFAPATAKARADEVEEERRVLYVGVTRARHSALVTVDLSRPVHPFMIELSAPHGPLRRSRAQEREQAALLADVGLNGLPWDDPSPPWLPHLDDITPAQARALVAAFAAHGRVLETRLSATRRRHRHRWWP